MQVSQPDTRYNTMSQPTVPADGVRSHTTVAAESELLAVKQYLDKRWGGSALLNGLEDIGGLTFELDSYHLSISSHAPRATRLLMKRSEEGYVTVCTWAYITVHDRKPVTLTFVEETVAPGQGRPARRPLLSDELPRRPLVSPFEACMEATGNNVASLKALTRYYFLWKGVVSWEELVELRPASFLAELYTVLLVLQEMKLRAAYREKFQVDAGDSAMAAQNPQPTMGEDVTESVDNFLSTLTQTLPITEIPHLKRKASFSEEEIQSLLAFGGKRQKKDSVLGQLEVRKLHLQKMKQDQQKEIEEHFGDPCEVLESMAKRFKKD